MNKPGMTPKGEKMPQTVEEWRYLADLYEKGMIDDNKKISKLRQRVNKLEQKLKSTRATATRLKNLIEDHNRECEDACTLRYCGYNRLSGDCPDCPRDWKIEK